MLLLALLLALPSPAQTVTLEQTQVRLQQARVPPAPLDTTCASVDKPVAFKYCISRTPGSRSTEVLYYLHGLGGNAKSWTEKDNYPAVMRRLWAAQAKDVPPVVTVSFGHFWLLAEKNASPNSGLFEFFTRYVMPAIEKEKLPGLTGRILIGESMGGFNATELVLKAPGLFERAALVCPAIANLPRRPSDAEFDDFLRRTGADRAHVKKAERLLNAIYPDDASYDAAAPLNAAKTLLGAATPPLNVSCGDKDEYGFYEGAEAFARLASAKGVSVRWESLKGGHCAADPAALAAFLLP